METRACIKRLMEDVAKRGEETPIVITTYDMVINGEYAGQLCDYELADEDYECMNDASIGMYEEKSTLGEMLYDINSPLCQSRLLSKHGIQYVYEPMEIVNLDKLKMNKELGEDEKLIDFIEFMSDTHNIEVSMQECIEQDCEMFENDLEVFVIYDANGNNDIVVDWIVALGYIDESDIILKEGCYIERQTIGSLYDTIVNQGAGEYHRRKTAKILSFPG